MNELRREALDRSCPYHHDWNEERELIRPTSSSARDAFRGYHVVRTCRRCGARQEYSHYCYGFVH